MENKRIKLTKCKGKLHLVKAIMDVTKKSLFESKNIADVMAMPSYNKITGTYEYKLGVLLLNESSITPDQWEEITRHPDFTKADVEFEYI